MVRAAAHRAGRGMRRSTSLDFLAFLVEFWASWTHSRVLLDTAAIKDMMDFLWFLEARDLVELARDGVCTMPI